MRARKAVLFAAVATAAIGSAGVALGADANTAVAADQQPSLVEDFSYPGADKILTDTGVKLISGDGHILFADCSTPRNGDIGLMRVRTTDAIGTNHDGLICFQVKAIPGVLVLKIPAAPRSASAPTRTTRRRPYCS